MVGTWFERFETPEAVGAFSTNLSNRDEASPKERFTKEFFVAP